tara:strand:- start:11610 stop:12500 length:891 start_codon:yes stop_codon:yes gene_type:complete
MRFFIFIVFSLVVIIILGLFTDGFSNRFTEKENEIFNSIHQGTNERNCLAADRDATRGLLERCIYGGNGTKILLIGDSHANHLNQFLLSLKDKNGSQPQIAEFTQGACNPILDFSYSISPSIEHATACFTKNSKTMNVISTYKPDIIVMSARWPRSNKMYQLIDTQLEVVDFKKFELKFEQTLLSIIALGVKVVVVNDIAGTGDIGYNCPIKRVLSSDSRTCLIDEPSYDDWFISLNNRLSKKIKYSFVDLNKVICNNGLCKTESLGLPLYKDEGHLNQLGSQSFANFVSYKDLLN